MIFLDPKVAKEKKTPPTKKFVNGPFFPGDAARNFSERSRGNGFSQVQRDKCALSSSYSKEVGNGLAGKTEKMRPRLRSDIPKFPL
jgi:hypothetical protein